MFVRHCRDTSVQGLQIHTVYELSLCIATLTNDTVLSPVPCMGCADLSADSSAYLSQQVYSTWQHPAPVGCKLLIYCE